VDVEEDDNVFVLTILACDLMIVIDSKANVYDYLYKKNGKSKIGDQSVSEFF